MNGIRRSIASAALALLAAPAAAPAQIGNPLPQSVAMGGNYIALARGFGAVAWNPAGLGMPDNPRFSLSLLPLTATAGLDPVTAADFAAYDGQIIPESVKREWLALIQGEGGESGNLGGDLTYLAFSIGRVAIQASSNVRARVNVAPDVAEVLLFGNAGYTGTPRSYDLEGSTFDLAGTSAVAASVAIPLSFHPGPMPDQHFAIGATVKVVMGNFLVLGQEDGSRITSDPPGGEVHFPMVHTALPDDSTDFQPGRSLDNGLGFGLDLGAAWEGGIFSAGVVVRNVINTFEWDLGKLRYRRGVATWTADSSYTSFEEVPVEEAPRAVLERIHDLYEFSPVLAVGAAARILPVLTLTGEVRHAVKDNLEVGARNHAGVGAELTILPIVPLRAGVALISGGYQLSGGLGVKLGPMQLSASGAVREAELGRDVVAAFGLGYGVR
ncbi:MAG TPA: DUF5723 family protein [Longimicrobiales bacterium]|nr:DUF5723 family protein [Longimicrobiales bacterium]